MPDVVVRLGEPRPGVHGFYGLARYPVGPCTHEPFDPVEHLDAERDGDLIQRCLTIGDVLGTTWAHTNRLLLCLDNLHYTMGEWEQAHRDWSRAVPWLKESLARRQRDGLLTDYAFLLRDPEVVALLSDPNAVIYR